MKKHKEIISTKLATKYIIFHLDRKDYISVNRVINCLTEEQIIQLGSALFVIGVITFVHEIFKSSNVTYLETMQ